MENLFTLIAILLLIAWGVGFFGYSAGSMIHLLIILAVIAIILRLIQGKNK